ncbi:hypothetical protein FSP39_014372 [Pinctada imbricata]|uniref:DNA polymerase delta subunit 4 n=1 Tax=Pinctada imbricata TaxID=66713 RepID=A0AA88XFM3_PINIB|nr:hypothetical protein FSP39_014372 [Pinctada imbricata]
MSSNTHITDSFKSVKRAGCKLAVKKDVTEEPPVSKQTSEDLVLLKQFDLTLEFGPCVGITRLERWERAEKHGLNPPPEVRDLVVKHRDNPEYLEW